MRTSTERPVTVDQGTNVLVGLDPDRIIAAAQTAATAPRGVRQVPDLWDGHAARRILDILTRT
jgi:UDP-N-acetylglucosamine 2-epimerase (non-hydrolysing)